MQPIAQTFIINEPSTGVEGMFLTGIDVYFQSVSKTYGFEVQIRETLNGFPTQTTLPYASKILQPASVSASSDASVATNFTFDTPVYVATNTQYAIVVIPVGGNPDYTIWTCVLGGVDVTTAATIYTNNQLGNLFISSNDLNFTQIQNESMKYNLYTAQFNQTSGTAVYRNRNDDFFKVKDINGSFATGERVVISNNVLQLASLTIAGSNTYTVGELVVQPNTATSAMTASAYGTVYFANTTQVLLSNTSGAFSTVGGNIKGLTSALQSAQPSAVFQNNSTTSACNVIYVVDANTSHTTDFIVNNYIYVGTNNRSTVQVAKITAADSVNKKLTLSSNINFTDSNAIVGRVRGDLALTGNFRYSQVGNKSVYFTVGGVNSNVALNFANCSNNFLIGMSSGASANVVNMVDIAYESITPQFAYISPKDASMSWGFSGTANTGSGDASLYTITPDVPYEFTDEQRIIQSRSHEFTNPIGGIPGTHSVRVQNIFSSYNPKTSPYQDVIRNNIMVTSNIIMNPNSSEGFYISVSNTSGSFTVGDTISQTNTVANTTGTIISTNSSFVTVANVYSSNTNNIGSFNANGTSIVTSGLGVTANVSAVIPYNEASSNGLDKASRYISKNVILAPGQDAENLVVYISAYRPAGTNFQVYGKLLAGADGDSFNTKSWSRLVDISPSGLFSSSVNRDDYVELSFTLPTSSEIYPYGGTTNTTPNASNILTMPSTGTSAVFSAGSYVYVEDKSFTLNTASIVAAGSGYANGDTVSLTGTPGYTNASFTVYTNATGNVASISVLNSGSYISNTVITANTTSNTSGIGTGMTLTVNANNFVASKKFNVRQVTSVPNTSCLILSSNLSIATGNSAIATIPNLNSQTSAFLHSDNNNIVRYSTATDGVYDTYLTFAIKIVMTANSQQIVPRMNNIRCLALTG